jgi:hypothetical protein
MLMVLNVLARCVVSLCVASRRTLAMRVTVTGLWFDARVARRAGEVGRIARHRHVADQRGGAGVETRAEAGAAVG